MTNQTELLERSINMLNKYGENDNFIAEIKEALEQPKEKKYLYAYSYDGLIVWAESNQNIADRFVFIGKIEVQYD